MYSFTYDSFGNPVTTKVGERTLITNAYNSQNNGLASSAYRNGDTAEFSYNLFGSLSHKKVNGNVLYKWAHDSSATPTKYVDYVNNLCYNYTYDSTGRLVRQKASTRNGSMGSSDRIFSSEYGYDLKNNVSVISNYAGKKQFSTRYEYTAKDNLPSKATIFSNRFLTFGYDALNRVNSKSIKTDIPVNTNYVYLLSNRNSEGQDVYRTRNVRIEIIGNTAYRYSYDSRGNITKIEQGTRTNEGDCTANNYSSKLEYFYDANNQLIRENNAYLGKTVLYNYDDKGNRTAKYEFSYFDSGSPNGPPVKSTYVDYRDTGWGDLATHVYGDENATLTYDEIGNPLPPSNIFFCFTSFFEFTQNSGYYQKNAPFQF